MRLTAAQIQECRKAIAETGASRETMFAARSIPDDYLAGLGMVEKTTAALDVPAVGLPVTVHLVASKDRLKNCPVHVNLHGGGFYFGHTGDDDLYCAHLAIETQGIVVDVDYALCPEHPFPVAFEQSYEAVRWAFARCPEWGADRRRVSVGGQSAGGNLAAAIALRAARSGDFRLSLHVLDYAAMDLAKALCEKTSAPGNDDPMEKRSAAFSMMYCGGDTGLLDTPYVSPSLAPDEMLRDLAPMLVVSAGKCPFRVLDEEYGLRAARQGVEVTMKRFGSSRHGFTVRMMDEWRESQAFIAMALRRAGL